MGEWIMKKRSALVFFKKRERNHDSRGIEGISKFIEFSVYGALLRHLETV